MRTPFPQERIAEIIDEVDALMREAEDVAMRERLNGQRCTCCNAPLKPDDVRGECRACREL